MHEYTKTDCENALNRIIEKGYVSKGTRKEYSEAQIAHFRYLIYVVFNYSALYGFCHDFLWGSKFVVSESREEVAVLSKTKIKRSLTIQQEKDLLKEIMADPCEDGKLVALLLMFSLGLRDGEACGLDFGDIRVLPYHEDCYVAIIRQTTIPNTCIVQSSGKTWNSGRKIPIPDYVADFLLKRKQAIEQIIAEEDLDIDIDRVPVAGAGYVVNENHTCFDRLMADRVTDQARTLFKNVGIEAEVLGTLELEMEEDYKKLEVSESNVTAYLLRRNYATHLKVLGLDLPDIQYLLGHCIEDPYVNRPDYTDDKLYSLIQKLRFRPLLNKPEASTIIVEPGKETIVTGEKQLVIPMDGDILKIRMTPLEQGDQIMVSTINTKQKDQRILAYESNISITPARKINILSKYVKGYE